LPPKISIVRPDHAPLLKIDSVQAYLLISTVIVTEDKVNHIVQQWGTMSNSDNVLCDQTGGKNIPPCLLLELDKEHASALFCFLQSGFFVAGVRVGCSVSALLTEQLGISQDYIHDHISTIFLDGKPVDDLDSAIIRHGSRLALSSAMPGLVGATMRQGSIFASFRNTITYRESGIRTGGEGMIHLKLFNLVMEDLGLSLLSKGILVDSAELTHFVHEHDDLLKACTKILVNNEPVEMAALLSDDFSKLSKFVKLSVGMAVPDVSTGRIRE